MIVLRILKRCAYGIGEFAGAYHPAHAGALAVSVLEDRSKPVAVTPSSRHLQKATTWIKSAQDAVQGGGVAWGYRARCGFRRLAPLGWIAPYPETTGYIIPSMIRYAELTGDTDSLERARRMADWETAIQLPDGGFQGGIFGDQPVASSTFVTGQVLFGLTAAYERFREEHVRDAALRAGDWLLSCLDYSGRFIKGYSHFCAPGPKAYEVRTGAALAELADSLDEPRFREAAARIAGYALSMQQPNGWFAENDLNFEDQPLTHTIGYVLEGLQGIAVRLNREDLLEAVRTTLDAIEPLIGEDGRLPGRFRADWSPAVDWVCLTGSAQLAGVFLRMYMLSSDIRYFHAGKRLLGFVCFTQDLGPGIQGLDGGIRGSYPFGGAYGQWCVLNWATKFFADSLMEYFEAERTAIIQAPHQNPLPETADDSYRGKLA